MIVPAGRRREQVNQGGRKHESIFDYDLFKNFVDKKALLKASQLSLVEPPQEETGLGEETDLDRVMQNGNMRGNNLPEQAELKKNVQPNESTSPDPVQDTDAQTQTPANALQQQLETIHGARVGRIITKFLQELQDAQMMPATFSPDPMKTEFRIGGGGLELRIPAQMPGTKAVQYPGAQ